MQWRPLDNSGKVKKKKKLRTRRWFDCEILFYILRSKSLIARHGEEAWIRQVTGTATMTPLPMTIF